MEICFLEVGASQTLNIIETPTLFYSRPETMKTKKFTILHSNDMHGDFLAEIQGQGGKLIGGLSLLSG